MARSDVGLLGTDLTPSGPFFFGRAKARWLRAGDGDAQPSRPRRQSGRRPFDCAQGRWPEWRDRQIPTPRRRPFDDAQGRPPSASWPSALRLRSGQAATRGTTRPTSSVSGALRRSGAPHQAAISDLRAVPVDRRQLNWPNEVEINAIVAENRLREKQGAASPR